VYGAIALDTAKFTFRFTPVFNGATFFEFLRQLAHRYDRRKVFLIIDNAPCHQLEADGQRWLRQNRHRIELHRLPSYSPEFGDGGRVEDDAQTHDPQRVLCHPRPARRQVDRDLQSVPAPSQGNRSSCREVSMISNPRETVLVLTASTNVTTTTTTTHHRQTASRPVSAQRDAQ
jgi:hypothetical protein